MVPKLKLAGVTPSLAGVMPTPVTRLVELPPLLVKTRLLLNVPAVTGMKLTLTVPVWPGATLYGVPLLIANGLDTATLPVRVRPPVLITENGWVLVWPMIKVPKF